MPFREDLILLGRITGTHGVRGQVKVLPYSGEADGVQAARTLFVKGVGEQWSTYPVAAVSGHGRKLLVRLQQCETIEQVQPLVGQEIYALRAELPPLDEGEYYWQDLLGMRVVTDGGELLGTIADIFSTGSNDVYSVRGERKEYLIPAIADVVVNVDLEQRIMTISPLEGLLDL
jgi:16S rRNA processing protein RimM